MLWHKNLVNLSTTKKMRKTADLVDVDGGAGPAQVPELGDHDVSSPQLLCTAITCYICILNLHNTLSLSLSTLVYTLLH